jgi:hypothetical protein
MASFGFDVALGREVEFWNRVNDSDPTNAVFVLAVLANSGIETDAVLRTKTTFTDLVSGTTAEVTNSGYSRIVLDDTDIDAYTVDTTNHRITPDLDDQTFSSIVAGDSWRKLVLGYDSDSTGGTDANIIPVSAYDLLVNGVAVVPNGSDIIVGFGNGVFTAS